MSVHLTAERRRCLRTPITDPQFSKVDIKFANTVCKQSGLVLDLAESGIAVLPFRPFPQETYANPHLQLWEITQPLASSVAWKGPDGRVGLWFIDPSSEVLDQLRKRASQESSQPSSSRIRHAISTKASVSPGLETALQAIADRVRMVTGASGVAIALGNQKGMECHVASGEAPAVGARLQPDEGLSGYSIRTGTIVQSDDLRLDSRLDSAKTAKLGIRSVVMAPLVANGEISGLLAALSSRPNAFDDQDLINAVYFGDLINAAIEENRPVSGARRKTASQKSAEVVAPILPSLKRSAGVISMDASTHGSAAVTSSVSIDAPSPATWPRLISRSPATNAKLGIAISMLGCLLAMLVWMNARGHSSKINLQASNISTRKNTPLQTGIPVDQQRPEAKVSATLSTPDITAAASPREDQVARKIDAIKALEAGSQSFSGARLPVQPQAETEADTHSGLASSAEADRLGQTALTLPSSSVELPPPEISVLATGDTMPVNPPVHPTAKVVGPPDFVPERTVNGHSSWVTSIAFSEDGQQLVSGSWDSTVKFWDVSSGHELSAIACGKKRIQALALSRDGRWVAGENADNDVTLWNATTGQRVRTLAGSHGAGALSNAWVYTIAFSPNGRWLASGVDNRTVRLWEVETGNRVRDLVSDPRSVTYIAFSADGGWLASGVDLKSIGIWNVVTGRLVRTLNGHSSDVLAVAFSPDGQLLASAGADKTVRIWNVATGKEVRVLHGHRSRVTSIAFSSDGHWLASGSWDNTIRIWDVETGRQLRTLTGSTNHVYTIAFDSRDGWLASGSEDGNIRFWRLVKPDVASNRVTPTDTSN